MAIMKQKRKTLEHKSSMFVHSITIHRIKILTHTQKNVTNRKYSSDHQRVEEAGDVNSLDKNINPSSEVATSPCH